MKNKLIFVNDVPKQFENDKDYILETIEKYFKSLKFDYCLKVKFEKSIEENSYEITDCFVKNKSITDYELIISYSLLSSISGDGGRQFYLALRHEFDHIIDFAHMMQTGLFKHNICLKYHKTIEETYITTGFGFWTEIYAYRNTYKCAKQNGFGCDKITFGRLVKDYVKTIELNKKLYYKQDLSYEEARGYMKAVDSFVYLCAKFMTAVYSGNARVLYAKAEKDKNYKKVLSILCDLEISVAKLLNNPYCSKSYDYLLRLGKKIWQNVKWKVFKVGLTKSKGKFVPFY